MTASTHPLPHFPMVIGGQRVRAASGRRYETVNPFAGQPWATAAVGSAHRLRPGQAAAQGGEPATELGGYFVRPTVLTDVSPEVTVACEEVFGPVLAVMPFDTEEEAIALVNGTRYGLAGAVWTTKAIWVELTGGTRDPFTLG